MLRRIDDVYSRAHHGDGTAARVQRALVRLGIDAAGESADHGEPLGGEFQAESTRHALAGVHWRCARAKK